MMTETQELTLRRDTLKRELEKARDDVLARDQERKSALAELTSQRDELQREVEKLQREVDAFEASMLELNETWTTATREAAGAKKHLEQLLRES